MELDNELFVYEEGMLSFRQWADVRDQMGRVVLSGTGFKKPTYAAVRFETFSGDLIHRGSFRREICEPARIPDFRWKQTEPDRFVKISGMWWRWPEPIVIKPWQVPENWGELRIVGERLGVDVDRNLREVAKGIRRHGVRILFLGYPIPRKIGEEPVEMHWQTVRLPKIETKPPKGYRPTDDNFWERCDCRESFGPNHLIRYTYTRNWHPSRLQARGRFKGALRRAKIAVVGSGALGSIMAELLARGGVQNMMLIDHEKLDAGNLVRHVLTSDDLREYKAEAMAVRLAKISPYINVTGVKTSFPISKDKMGNLLGDVSLLIDCTGSDGPLFSMASYEWPIPKLFVSVFLGFRARRLFLFVASGKLFPIKDFRDKWEPWKQHEKILWAQHEEVLEGAGCWSPLFPARYDDVVLGAATAVKVVDGLATAWPQSPQMVVFEQKESSGFAGFHRVPPECPAARA